MIRVIFPNAGPLINLEDRIISDIVHRIFKIDSYNIESENRRTGRYVKIVNDDNDEIHYVCLSNPDNDSRNARLMQFISPAYVEYWNEQNENKEFDIYIIDPDRNDRTPYAKMFYRCFITIGIKMLNWESLGLSGLAYFTSYDDLKNCRNNTSNRNLHNRQTYFVDESESGINQISLYGKTFGANAMESFVFALTLNKICDKPVVFYQVVDNESETISVGQQNVLQDNGVQIGETIQILPNGKARPLPVHQRKTSRDTTVFHYNLLQKYGEKRCYVCGCDIEHMVIGSHIERVTDIDRNNNYDDAEKSRRSTDGDNGLWLCANHDKMFEYGIIYFIDRTLSVGPIVQNQTDRDFINHSFETIETVYSPELSSVGEISQNAFLIRNEHFNASMHEYLEKHKNRISSV